MQTRDIRKDVGDKSLFFESLTVSDLSVVKLLIEYRHKYDSYFYSDRDDFFNNAGEIQTINENTILMYASLDDVIEKCNFSDEQMKIVGMMSHGFSLKDIAYQLDIANSQTIRNRFNTICKQIVEQNLWDWRKVIYRSLLDLKSKKCSKCKEELPGTHEFYRDDTRMKDGFQGRCRRCEK